MVQGYTAAVMDESSAQDWLDACEALAEHGCDFALAAKELAAMMDVWRVEAAAQDGTGIYRPDFAVAVAAFMNAPSAVSAAMLLEAAPSPSFLALFEGCLPGGLFRLGKDW
jgi:hypothetical protein